MCAVSCRKPCTILAVARWFRNMVPARISRQIAVLFRWCRYRAENPGVRHGFKTKRLLRILLIRNRTLLVDPGERLSGTLLRISKQSSRTHVMPCCLSLLRWPTRQSASDGTRIHCKSGDRPTLNPRIGSTGIKSE